MSKESVCIELMDPEDAKRMSTQKSDVLKLIFELEDKEKIFEHYGFVEEKDVSPDGIYNYMDNYIKKLVGYSFADFGDAPLRSAICFAFYNDPQYRDMWKECDLPLFAGLVIVYVLQKMSKNFEDVHENAIYENYRDNKNEMDKFCYDFLHFAFRKDKNNAKDALRMNYRHLLEHSNHPEEPHTYIDLLEVAAKGKARSFISHPLCQKLISERWQPHYVLSMKNSYFCWFTLWTCIPTLKTRGIKPAIPRSNGKIEYLRNTIELKFQQIKLFYPTTNSKYILHMLISCIYVILFAKALVNLPQISHEQKFHGTVSLGWYIRSVLFWQCTFLVEMALQLIDYHRTEEWRKFRKIEGFKATIHEYIEYERFDAIRNFIISLTFSFFFPAYAFPIGTFSSVAQACVILLFYVTFTYAAIRSLRILYADPFFGAIVLMLKKMVPLFFRCFCTLLFFWGAYAVCHVSVSGPQPDNIAWLFFQNGAFEVFGEAEEAKKEGNVTNCPDFDWDNVTNFSVHCAFRSWSMPILMFLYMLVVAIVLVNLITALLTAKYEEITRFSDIYWKAKLYDRLVEYERKRWLPPPLNILYVIVFIWNRIAKKCCKSYQYEYSPPAPDDEFSDMQRDNIKKTLIEQQKAWLEEYEYNEVNDIVDKIVSYFRDETKPRSRTTSKREDVLRSLSRMVLSENERRRYSLQHQVRESESAPALETGSSQTTLPRDEWASSQVEFEL